MQKEVWKDVLGWEGIYQISNHGNLKSFKKIKTGRTLKNTNKMGGYLSVVLAHNDMPKRYTRIHILVAEAFIPRIPGKPHINHIDGNKQNNDSINLEWVTMSENMIHAAETNPSFLASMKRYNQIERPIPVIQKTFSGEIVNIFRNCIDAGKITGVCSRNIHQVASKTEYKPGMTRKQAGGFLWEFDYAN